MLGKVRITGDKSLARRKEVREKLEQLAAQYVRVAQAAGERLSLKDIEAEIYRSEDGKQLLIKVYRRAKGLRWQGFYLGVFDAKTLQPIEQNWH